MQLTMHLVYKSAPLIYLANYTESLSTHEWVILIINLVRSVIAERLDADESFISVCTGVLRFPLTALYPQTSSQLAQYDWNTTTHPHAHSINGCRLIPCGFDTSLDIKVLKLTCLNFCYSLLFKQTTLCWKTTKFSFLHFWENLLDIQLFKKLTCLLKEKIKRIKHKENSNILKYKFSFPHVYNNNIFMQTN